MRLIDADAFMDDLTQQIEFIKVLDISDLTQVAEVLYEGMKVQIEKMPTIEAEPIRHGKLMRTEAYPHKLYCGKCYNTLIPNDEAVEQNWMLKPRYCMYCGAKLDEVEE